MTTLTNAGGTDDGIQGSTQSHDKNGLMGLNNDSSLRNATTPEGNGVFGFTQVPDGAGVFGLHNTGGVGIAGFGHPAGIGVVGMSVPINAKGGDGVLGVSNSEHRNGVVGMNGSSTPRAANDPGGNGVFGFTEVPDGAGVFGAHASTGVGVAGLGLIGVSGGSVDGFGVVGVSAPPGAKGGDGVQGVTNSETRNGVYGLNLSQTSRNNSDAGGNGIFGFTSVPNGAGVLGANNAGGTGVVGTGEHGVAGTGVMGVVGVGTAIGVWGIAKGGWAAYFTGPVAVDGEITGPHGPVQFGNDVNINGNLTISSSGDVILADCAEEFEVSGISLSDVGPGSVMVLDETGAICPCSQAYDSRTVGVVSGAGQFRPAITLDRATSGINRAPISLLGKVCCKVDATFAPIKVGDLLTTSLTKGHAMKASDPVMAVGAVIGKALEPLNEGRALIQILVTLQ